MSGVISGFERVMMPLAARISGNKYLLAMRDAFSMLLPFIIVGSFFGIVQWVLLDPWGTVMGANGLNLGAAFTGLDTAGEAYKHTQFVRSMQVIQGLCNNVVTVGFGVFSFLLVAAFAYRLGTIWGGDPFANALTALGAFIIVTPQSVGDIGAFDLSYFGNKAVLTAIIVATVSSKMFINLSKNQKLTIKMPDTVPPAVANSFAVLMPVFITLFSFTLFSTFLAQMEFMGSKALNDLIYALIQAPLMGFSQGIGFSILYQGIVPFRIWSICRPSWPISQAMRLIFSPMAFLKRDLCMCWGCLLPFSSSPSVTAGGQWPRLVFRRCSSIFRNRLPLGCQSC